MEFFDTKQQQHRGAKWNLASNTFELIAEECYYSACSSHLMHSVISNLVKHIVRSFSSQAPDPFQPIACELIRCWLLSGALVIHMIYPITCKKYNCTIKGMFFYSLYFGLHISLMCVFIYIEGHHSN